MFEESRRDGILSLSSRSSKRSREPVLQAGLLTYGSSAAAPFPVPCTSGAGRRARQSQWRVREGISPSSLYAPLSAWSYVKRMVHRGRSPVKGLRPATGIRMHRSAHPSRAVLRAVQCERPILIAASPSSSSAPYRRYSSGTGRRRTRRDCHGRRRRSRRLPCSRYLSCR